MHQTSLFDLTTDEKRKIDYEVYELFSLVDLAPYSGARYFEADDSLDGDDDASEYGGKFGFWLEINDAYSSGLDKLDREELIELMEAQ